VNGVRRTLASAVVVAACVAGCGNSSAHSPATVIRDGHAALAGKHSVGFDVRVRLVLHGHLKGAGPAAALLTGPVTLALRGHSATTASVARAAFDFTLDVTGGVLEGRVLAPGGRTAYIQLPTLLGPGWHSFPVGAAPGAPTERIVDMSSLDPVSWLSGLHMVSHGGTDTLSAGLNVSRMLTDIVTSTGSSVSASERRELAATGAAVRTARGSISYDAHTHLPSAFQATLVSSVPRSLAGSSHGLTGIDLRVWARFSDWGKSFTVQRPASSTPLNTLLTIGSDSRH
jgi:hypothetical protein